MFQTAVVDFKIPPSDFWKMTVGEFWSIHDKITGVRERKMFVADVKKYAEKIEAEHGRVRRVTDTTQGR